MKRISILGTMLIALAFGFGTTACEKTKGKSSDSPPSTTTDDGTSSASTGDYEPGNDGDEDPASATKPVKPKCGPGCVPSKGSTKVKCPKGCVPAKKVKKAKRQRRRYRPQRRYRRPATVYRTPTTVASGGLSAVDREQNRRLDAGEAKDKAQDVAIEKNSSDIAAIEEAREKEAGWRKDVDDRLEARNK